MPKKYLIVILLLILGAAAPITGSCRQPFTHSQKTSEITVITTIFPLADMIERIGGENISVSCLLPPGASPHDFEPAVEQVKTASRSLLFVSMGGGLDDWADSTAQAGSRHTRVLSLYEQTLERGWLPDGEPFAGNAEASFSTFNPHLWLDPLTTRDYLCPAIADALMKEDPNNAACYQANLAAYQAELTALNDEIGSLLSKVPNKKFISVHGAWQYFATRYGLDEAAVISEFPGQEPSATSLTSLISFCRAQEIRVIAAEPQFSDRVAGMIAREIGGEVILLDPLGGAGLDQRNSYLNLMRYNAAVLKDALSK
ncbi:MAG: zinc ABC transporter substrate-binding protein [Firmicutes bacterium]|nr:zinc ABC transporter substrate-binding protein [Bacillota bacterium]